MIKHIIIYLALLSGSCFAQGFGESQQTEVPQSQVTFLSAKAAEIAPTPDGNVAILAEDLAAKQEYGVIATLPVGIKWIEVHPALNPFPAQIVQPYKDQKFLIRGTPGEKLYVSGRGGDLPIWFNVEIAPASSPPQPPPPGPVDPAPVDPKPPTLPGLEGIKKLSAEKAQLLQDDATRLELKNAIQTAIRTIEASCATGQCPGLDRAKSIVVGHIDACMLARPKPNVDWWAGWRKPISEEIKKRNPADVPTYIAMMRAAAEGL